MPWPVDHRTAGAATPTPRDVPTAGYTVTVGVGYRSGGAPPPAPRGCAMLSA